MNYTIAQKYWTNLDFLGTQGQFTKFQEELDQEQEKIIG